MNLVLSLYRICTLPSSLSTRRRRIERFAKRLLRKLTGRAIDIRVYLLQANLVHGLSIREKRGKYKVVIAGPLRYPIEALIVHEVIHVVHDFKGLYPKRYHLKTCRCTTVWRLCLELVKDLHVENELLEITGGIHHDLLYSAYIDSIKWCTELTHNYFERMWNIATMLQYYVLSHIYIPSLYTYFRKFWNEFLENMSREETERVIEAAEKLLDLAESCGKPSSEKILRETTAIAEVLTGTDLYIIYEGSSPYICCIH